MAKTIEQTVIFKNTTPKRLYDLYWNPWKQYLAGKPITRPSM